MNAASRPPVRAGAGTAWYVYGVVPADTAPALLDGARGLGGTAPRLVAEGDVAGVVSEVSLDEFDDEPLALNLHDPAWLESRVRLHDDVLARLVGEAPVVPFRFGAIYRSEDHVRALLADDSRLREALEGVRGRVELGVKGFLDAGAAAEPSTEADVSPGRRYLEQKQEARRAAEEREALRARAADESHERLAAVAEQARANALQPPEAAGHDGEMFLNGAYLVPVADEGAFRAAVASLDRELGPSGISFELTGPWPPYNFVEVER